MNPHPRGEGPWGRVFPGHEAGDLAESRFGGDQEDFSAPVRHAHFLRPTPPGGPRKRAVLVFVRHRDVESDRPFGIELGADLDAPFVDDPGIRPCHGHLHRLLRSFPRADDPVLVSVPGVLDDRRSAPGVGRIDEELTAILGVPHGFPGPVEDHGIVPNLDGDIEGAFARVVGDAKVGFQVIIAAELVAELDAFDGVRLQVFGQSLRSPSTVIPFAG